MASYRGHLATSTVLAGAYGAAGFLVWHFEMGPVVLGAALTALGGLLPDLDSDSGVPVRWLFLTLALATPVVLFTRLTALNLSPVALAGILLGVYVGVRYVLAEFFKRLTVHRGMFHSIPGLLIAGLAVFLMYHTNDVRLRLLLAGGVMLGFLSHLVLDELWAVDLRGYRIRLNRMAGSALKWTSPSLVGTAFTYAVLAGLVWLALQTVPRP